MKTFHLTIASLDKNVFDGFVHTLTVPGSEGEMTILAQHMPLISRLASGAISYITDAGDTQTLVVTHGVIEITASGAAILI